MWDSPACKLESWPFFDIIRVAMVLPPLIPPPRMLRLGSGTIASSHSVIHEEIDRRFSSSQAYRLAIEQGRISIVATGRAGVFYARQTLAQLRRHYGENIPELMIDDWPDFSVRGFMLDVSRDKVPTMASLFALIDKLAELKINQLQLYTEHTFAYRAHGQVWKNSSPLTGEEIRQLDSYCRERFIELVPNQNSFGHLERWFKHPAYHHLAEKPDGFVFPTGKKMASGFSLNPIDPRSIAFVESLYDELLPNFTSRLFNVGCDETFDLGLGRSKSAVEQRGRERVYLEFLKKVHSAVASRGRTMMFWGDIILTQPQLLSELPRDIIALNWGYEADHPFDTETRALQQAGVPFYVCPGTSSWCSISGRTDNCLANLRLAAEQGLKHGASGYLITDWGDYGHLQYWPISLLGLAAGAANAWCAESAKSASLVEALNTHLFQDRSGVMGQLMHDFGNVYQAAREPLANGSRFFWSLIDADDRQNLFRDLTIDEYDDALARIEHSLRGLSKASMARSDGERIRDEIRNAAEMLRVACLRNKSKRSHSRMDEREWVESLRHVLSEHRRLWLARNRDGGLADSCAHLARLIPA